MFNMVAKDLPWRQMTDGATCGSLQKLVTSLLNSYLHEYIFCYALQVAALINLYC